MEANFVQTQNKRKKIPEKLNENRNETKKKLRRIFLF